MVVVLDACVLYPPSLRDLLLTLAALDAFDIRWSELILDELTRNVLADNPAVDRERFTTHTVGSMRRAFPEAMTTVDEGLVAILDNDPGDRHDAAVALGARADGIITLNVKDFRSTALKQAAVDVVTPGALTDRLLDEAPDIVVDAIHRMSARWIRPPRTPTQITELLAVHPTMSRPMRRLHRRVA